MSLRIHRHPARHALLAVLAAAALSAGALIGIGTAQAATSLPCDIYAAAGTPCVAAHSTALRDRQCQQWHVLDAVNCGTANGVRVDQWQWLNNTCQQWTFAS